MPAFYIRKLQSAPSLRRHRDRILVPGGIADAGTRAVVARRPAKRRLDAQIPDR